MAKSLPDLAALCLALGVDEPNLVTRVVVDVRGGYVPMLYVERIADAEKILATLTGPAIELRRERPSDVDPDAVVVGFCNWCPRPDHAPLRRHHPDGGPEHRE